MAVLDPRRRRRTTLILLILTSITVLSLDFQNFGPLTSVQGAVRSVVDPIASGLGSVVSPVSDGWKGLTEYDDLKAENERLQAEISEIRGTSIRARAVEDSLRELLDEVDIEWVGSAETLVAEIVDRPGNFESYAVEIDRGTTDGVRVGMPVVTSAGLVGRVSEVAENFSQVRLLHQPGFGVGVRFVGTGTVALAEGQGPGRDLEVALDVADETGISPGDPVVSSGIEGSSYPPDLVIGIVSDVELDSTQLQQTVQIRPVNDLESLRWVTVILWSVTGNDGS